MKKRLLRGMMVAALLLGGLASSAALTAPAQAEVAPASATSHGHTVQPLGGCVGTLCGTVCNFSDNFIWVSDNWDNGPAGNIVSIGPQTCSPFADTDALAPDQGCTAEVWLYTYPSTDPIIFNITDWTKISDNQQAFVTAESCF
jgi:hypothetical protein